MKKFLKSSLSLVLAIAIIFSAAVVGLDEFDFSNTLALKTKAASADDLTFTLSSDGTYYSVTGCAATAAGELVIPDVYNELPVKSIGSYALYGCTNLTLITIPDSVTNISYNAFDNTGYYNNAENWENDVLYIGKHLIKAKDTISGEYEIKEGTITIAGSAFSNCINLTYVKFPGSLIGIGDVAFAGCKSLNSLEFSEGIKTMGYIAFHGCTSLKSVTIPDSVTTIGEGVFYGCTGLEEVKLSENISGISNYAFYYCENLTSVSMPQNLKSIGTDAFMGCSAIKYVFFNGTEEAWSQIDGAANLDTTEVKIHYGATDHNIKETTIVKEPTCTEAGLKVNVCDCGHSTNITIPELGHTYSDWIIDKEATAAATGAKHKECTECDEFVETAVISQLKPATPELKAAANTGSGVKFTWGKVTGADSYIVYRRAYDAKTQKWSGWVRLADGVTSTSYVDKTVKSGTYYRYTIKAVNEAGNSGYNTSGIKTYFISAPKATTSNTTGAITVKWGKVAGATGYYVYRKTTGGWTRIGKTTGTTFTDKTSNVGVTYKYTVKAYYGSYASAYNTNGYAVRRLTTPLLKSVTSAKSGVTFNWSKVTGATGYYVYRKTGNGGWQKIATVKNTKVSHLDKTAKKGVTYTYTVKAYYGTSTSAYNTKGLTIKDKY